MREGPTCGTGTAYPSELYLREGSTCGAGTAYPSELYLRECPTCGAGTAYPSEFTPGCAALSLDWCVVLCRSLF
jgi:hypothetical protein